MCPATEVISPVVEIYPIQETIEVVEESDSWEGIGSYYSREGCIGCHPQMIMANGKPLDDSQLTVAFNWLPLGSRVLIENLSNGKTVEAEVTDTGGFNELGRIIDMGVATKEAIECSDLCEVRVTAL